MRQARILATAMLWYIEQVEMQQETSSPFEFDLEPEPIELNLNEKDFLNISGRVISTNNLSWSLGVSDERIFEAMKFLNIQEVGEYRFRKYLFLHDAKEIREFLMRSTKKSTEP